MNANIITVMTVLAALVIFLSLITVLKYAIRGDFARTRIIMTSLLVFLVATVTVAFAQYMLMAASVMAPAFLVGILLGERAGVHPAERRIATHGVAYYMEHYAHSSKAELKALTWWSIVNFYAIMSALIMMNLVGLSRILFEGHQTVATAVVAFGAFLIGTILPYVIHLWRVRYERN